MNRNTKEVTDSIESEPTGSQAPIRHNRLLRSLLFRLKLDYQQNLIRKQLQLFRRRKIFSSELLKSHYRSSLLNKTGGAFWGAHKWCIFRCPVTAGAEQRRKTNGIPVRVIEYAIKGSCENIA